MLHGGTSCDVECRCLISRPLRMLPASFFVFVDIVDAFTL